MPECRSMDMRSLVILDSKPPTRNPPVSILAPSVKRTHDVDSEPSAVSTPKRRKVSFAPIVDIHFLDDYDDKGFQLVREEVRRAIDKRHAGDHAAYDEIRTLFTIDPTSADAPATRLLAKYARALIANVSQLNKDCSGLVHAIIDCHWLARDGAFQQSYTGLLCSIISAYGAYTNEVLKSLIKHFHEIPSRKTRYQRHPHIKKSELTLRVHNVLNKILHVIPSAGNSLLDLLESSCPSVQEPAEVYMTYVNNVMKVVEYAPVFENGVLDLVTRSLTSIDVQMQDDLELDEEFLRALVEDEIRNRGETDDCDSDMDRADDNSDSGDSDNASSSDDDDSLNDDQRRVLEFKSSFRKIDSTMDALFKYYHGVFATSSDPEARERFKNLCTHFKLIMLPTYRSRHTQFLLFHFAQTSPMFSNQFIYDCAELTLDKSLPQQMQRTAAAYLASFVARGARVPARAVREVLMVLGAALDDFKERHEARCKGPSLERYSGYYAIFQALIYIFCFRWRDAIVGGIDGSTSDEEVLCHTSDLIWMPSLKKSMYNNIYSKFNPLKVCSNGVVTQFAHIAYGLGFLYVYPLLEANKRVRLSRYLSAASLHDMQARETALSCKTEESTLQLDSYFPFDPYALPISKRWLAGEYNEWKGIPGLEPEVGLACSDSDSPVDESESESEDDFLGGTAAVAIA